jgi:hypothetical protein
MIRECTEKGSKRTRALIEMDLRLLLRIRTVYWSSSNIRFDVKDLIKRY